VNTSKRELGRETLKDIMGEDYARHRDDTTNSFNSPLKLFIEENCFGDVWTRTGLDRKTRSLILISTLIALNRPSQVRAHVRSAINNGASIGEIQEVLYQTISYCGLPAAADGFRIAEEVLTEMGLFSPD
jgi:4-carboxymuconolactone decarboxylase